MNYRLPILAALALALFISACSQAPAELTAPTLEPQFGTVHDDRGIDVALAAPNRVYVLSEEFAPARDRDGYQSGFQTKALLKRYDGSGTLAWSKEIVSRNCNWDYDDDCSRGFLQPRSLHLDAKGNIYALISSGYIVDDSAYERSYSVRKLDAAGNVVRTIAVGTTGANFNSSGTQDFLDVAVDKGGAIYVAKRQWSYDYDKGYGSYRNLVAKYSTGGALLWQRTSAVGTPKGVVVSSTGNVYVVGSKGVSRYSSGGTLNWTKSGGGDDVAISGSHLYVRKGATIRKHDGSGKQLWSRAQSGLSGMVIAAMTGDDGGNVYLAGNSKTSTNRDAFSRKLSGSGSVVWTKLFGTAKDDDARGIATINGSDIYVTGETQGTLSHPNMGGGDGYLRKMDSSGNRVWTR